MTFYILLVTKKTASVLLGNNEKLYRTSDVYALNYYQLFIY